MHAICLATSSPLAERHKLSLINDAVTFVIHKLIILFKVGPSVIIVGYPHEKSVPVESFRDNGGRKKNVIET